MERNYIEDQVFDKSNFSEKAPEKGDYEYCKFLNCDFSGVNFSGFGFAECEFTGCNFSMAKLGKTAFKEVKFRGCKVQGLNFEHCDPFLFSFEMDGCIVNYSSFYNMKLKKTKFLNCTMHEADFTGTDLQAAVFDKSDLLNTKFEGTNLEGADFRSAINYSIDPGSNKIKKAKFSITGVAGLLDKFDIEIFN